MLKRSRKKKPAKEEMAGSILDAIAPQPHQKKAKNPAAVALGRQGGLKGGKARAAKLTKEQRSESARKAAKARWSKSDGA